MQPPPDPPDERARAAELHSLSILDTPPEERFDRYTRLARRLFRVPIALVSLVDTDRQWFKSRQGLEATETPRDVSFCGHTILDAEVFVIENTESDVRFCDNPLVTSDPHIRFYAGCPLVGPGGHRLGTLCVIDRTARSFDDEDRAALQDLAAMVSGELASLEMATTDELTGISNRRGFDVLSGQALAMCQRGEQPASVVMIDMDGFKAINDRFGHEEGDRALVAFARILRSTFRESDVIGRLGGDEFAALLTRTDAASACDAERRLREAVDAHNASSPAAYSLDYSAGVEAIDAGSTCASDALRRADEGMYARKLAKRAKLRRAS